MKKVVLFRVDANPRIGTGHLMRCIGLAESLKNHGNASHFITKSYGESSLRILKDSSFSATMIHPEMSIIDEVKLISALRQNFKSSLLVTDLSNPLVLRHLNQYEEYVKILRQIGMRILAFDGLGKDCIAAQISLPYDIVVIPYMGAEKRVVKISPLTTFLRGPKFFVFGKMFIKMARRKKLIRKRARKILVALGGGYQEMLQLKIIHAIQQITLPLEITCFTQTLPASRKYRVAATSKRLHFVSDVNRFATSMFETDLLITGSGLTKYEAALFGVPTMSVSLRKDHEATMHAFAKKKTLHYLDWADEIRESAIMNALLKLLKNYSERVKMSRRGKNLVDAKGGDRIFKILKQKKYL